LYKGYKEFFNYLFNPEPSQNGFSQAVDRMKLSTRQYAKRQISWIRNKLIPMAESANREDMSTPFYLLDATGCHYSFFISLSINLPAELGQNWLNNVQGPATKIMEGELCRSFNLTLYVSDPPFRRLPEQSAASRAKITVCKSACSLNRQRKRRQVRLITMSTTAGTEPPLQPICHTRGQTEDYMFCVHN